MYHNPFYTNAKYFSAPCIDMSSGGAVSGTPLIGDIFVQPFWVPDNVTLGVTKLACYNFDTVSDTDLSIRLGLYELDTSLYLKTLLVDNGTLSKDTTAITTPRQPTGGTFSSITLGPGKMYATVAKIENDLAVGGTSSGFYAHLGEIMDPWGCVGDDNDTWDYYRGNGNTTSVYLGFVLVTGAAAGALSSDLTSAGYPITDHNKRAPAVYYYVDSLTVT